MPLRPKKAVSRSANFSKYPDYPGYLLGVGAKGVSTVSIVQQRLHDVGCGPVDVSGVFDRRTREAVQLFQARSIDAQGQSLKVDGVVGPLTWGALFGQQTLPINLSHPQSPLLKASLDVATSQVGVLEDPPGSNRGPQVDEYLKSVGLTPTEGSFPWCAAFVFWAFDKAALRVGTPNPVVRTAGVLDHWNKAGHVGIKRFSSNDVLKDFTLLKPGLIFVISTGGGKGHMGLVQGFQDDRLITIEGNTNLSGASEGVGVFLRAARKISDINKGFINYDS